jgi:hypothetical protein
MSKPNGYLWVVLALAVGAVGCGGERSEREATPPAGSEAAGTAGAGGEHASADLVPGSYADWCGEHGVPETACTRCDPSLIPAFKAVGDWDEEHGLPKSQCLKCNPQLKIIRPPKPEGS